MRYIKVLLMVLLIFLALVFFFQNQGKDAWLGKDIPKIPTKRRLEMIAFFIKLNF